MRKIIFTLLFLNGFLLTSQEVIHKEILGRPTDKSITIRMAFDTNCEFMVEYGLTQDLLNNKPAIINANASIPTDLTLEGLSKNTTYYYRVLYRNIPNSSWKIRPVYRFTTQKNEDVGFTFVIQADPHLDEQSDTAVYSRCVKNQSEDHPDFIIDLGDIIMTDKLKNGSGKITRDTITSRCKYLRSFYEIAGHSAPYFMVLGNHEGEAGWTLNGSADNSAIISTQERKKYFMNPLPNEFYSGDDTQNDFVGLRENYYSWKWGDALFVVLDPYWYTSPKPDANTGWRWTLGKKQYDWLKTTLEMDNSIYKFVFCHQLVGGDPNGRGGIEFADLYEWGGNNIDGSYGFNSNRQGWYKPIKDILIENKVSAFFHGHDHFFGKQEKDCLIYQECPQPSHKSFQNANQAGEYGYVNGQILPNSGHIRVNVQPDEVKIEYVRAYSAANETPTRKNKDIAATYFIKRNDCYDTLSTSSTILWNSDYLNELIYPNPFSNDLNIQFSLTTLETLSLAIFDNQGKIVNYLMNKNKLSSGEYNIIWDGKNAAGQQMPNGMYVYHLITNKGKKSGKIILNK